MIRRVIKKLSLLLCIALIFTMVLTACGKKEEGSNAVDKIKSAGVLKVGSKVDVPKFGLQDTATGEYTGLEIDLAYEIAAKIFGVTTEEAKTKKMVE